MLLGVIRSSRPEVFCKKAVLRNFTKFTGKYLCQSLFFNRILFKIELCEISKNTFLREHLWWLLLCYWKFNTEVTISKLFEKLCHLIIDQKVRTYTTYWHRTKKNWCRYFDHWSIQIIPLVWVIATKVSKLSFWQKNLQC